MNINNKIKAVGRFEIFENGRKIKEFNNLITNILLDEMIGILAGYIPDIDIRYLAIGLDPAPAPAVGDTSLNDEEERYFYIDRSLTPPPTYGEIVTDFYLTSGDGNVTIEELGVFGGSTSSLAAGSGSMISHVLWNYTKTSAVELLIRYTVTLS
ncbi:MAG: hypothetical protein M0P71_17985 [Melioribacteraceae bacterium]|nr:hypothetical protein [Melioribacteraceae bacterium]